MHDPVCPWSMTCGSQFTGCAAVFGVGVGPGASMAASAAATTGCDATSIVLASLSGWDLFAVRRYAMAQCPLAAARRTITPVCAFWIAAAVLVELTSCPMAVTSTEASCAHVSPSSMST